MAKDGISDIPGLVSRAGNPLHFLGLFYTSHAASTRHHIPAKVVCSNLASRLIFYSTIT